MMDVNSKSKKTKSKNILVSTQGKKCKSDEASPCLPNDQPTQEEDESSFSPSLDTEETTGVNWGSVSASNLLTEEMKPAKFGCKARLIMVLKCLRFLLCQGWECHAPPDYGLGFADRGNLAELLELKAKYDKDCADAFLEKVPGSDQLIVPEIPKDLINDLIHSCARETSRLLVRHLSDDYFGIFIDECYDAEQMEHLAVYMRHVDRQGKVIERFLGLVNVYDPDPKVWTPNALSLKAGLDSLLMELSLPPSKIRGQSYNGACKMQDQFKALKTLIMKETESAFYVHRFDHDLHSTLVAASKSSIDDACWFFMTVADLLDLVFAACWRDEIFRETQTQKILEAFGLCEREGTNSLNQDFGLKLIVLPGNDSWRSDHYKILKHIVSLFPTIVEVLEIIENLSSNHRGKVQDIWYAFESFDFVLVAHLMMAIFEYTNELSLALQRNNIVNVVSLLSVVKKQLQGMRDYGWENLINKVFSFCTKNNIDVPEMTGSYKPLGRFTKRFKQCTSLHYYQVDVFLAVIDSQLQELNTTFDKVNVELLTCMACLSPADCFSSFDKEKIIRFAKLYPYEFPSVDLLCLEFQLDNFIVDMRSDVRFSNLKDLGELSMKLVETEKHVVWSQVYLLLKLALILPVVTPSEERLSSTMKCVKKKLRSSKSNKLFYDSLITYVEEDVFSKVLDDDVINCLQTLRSARM